MAKFDVLRQHYGDRMYEAGDTREAEAREVKHLVASGVLKAAAPAKDKAEPAVKNKAAK